MELAKSAAEIVGNPRFYIAVTIAGASAEVLRHEHGAVRHARQGTEPQVIHI